MIAESAVARGVPVHIVAIDGEADAASQRLPAHRCRLGPDRPHGARRSARRGHRTGDCRRVSGGPTCSDPARPRLLPEPAADRPNSSHRGAATIPCSRGVVRFFEAQGFHGRRRRHEVAPELLVPGGADRRLSLVARRSTRTSRSALTCVARSARSTPARLWWWRDGRLLAIEGAEGTDAMLRACGVAAAVARPRASARVGRPRQRSEARPGAAHRHAGDRAAHRRCAQLRPSLKRYRGEAAPSSRRSGRAGRSAECCASVPAMGVEAAAERAAGR